VLLYYLFIINPIFLIIYCINLHFSRIKTNIKIQNLHTPEVCHTRLIRPIKEFYVLLLLLFLSAPSYCQIIENRFTHFTEKDGLSEGDKSCLVQDSVGYIWISTENGLDRFDGYNFKNFRFNFSDTNTLRENRLVNLFIDSKKRLWVLSFHWLHLYHPEGDWFEHFSLPNASADLFVRICAEENDNLIITSHHGLYKFNEVTKKFNLVNYEGAKLDGYDYYKKDENGIEWITGSFGLARYDPNSAKIRLFDSSIFKHVKNENISCRHLVLLPNDNLLIGTYNYGLILFNRKTFHFKQYLLNKINPFFPIKQFHQNFARDRTDCIYKLNDSIILCSVGGGLSVLNLNNDSIKCFIPDETNPVSLLEKDLRIWYIFKDREGILWLGGKNLECYNFKDYTFKYISPKTNPNTKNAFAIFGELYRTKQGNFLLGNNGGMNMYDPAKDRLYDLSDIPYKRITNFNEDGQGKIWCFKKGGLCKFIIQNDKIKNEFIYDIPYKYSGLHDVKLDHNGRILIATSKGLIIFDTASSKFSIINSSSSYPLNINYCTAICTDHNGCSWIGTQNGLNKIEPDGVTVKQYNNNKYGNLLKDCWINDIKEDSHGIIWFATNAQGIGRLDPNKDSLSFFSTEQGLPTCKYDNICIDNKDELWALTSTGNIVIINVVTLHNKLCTPEEGFPKPEDINAIHYSKETECIYLLTNNSIIEVSERKSNQNFVLPTPLITGISVFNKEKKTGQNNYLNLAYNDNFINIEFACLQFHNNSQIKYAYKLSGIDKDWVYCNYKRSAPYTNLQPGKYVFNVKALSPDGVWSQPTILNIIISPPYWQTWWFYLFEIIIIIAILIWIIRLYTLRKLNKQKVEFEKTKAVSDERSRIASDMHDDLGAGLTSIRLLSEIANIKTTEDSSTKNEIRKIVRVATNLSENLKEIIWTMNSNFDKLEDFVIYIRSYSIEFFDTSSIELQFIAPTTYPEILLPGELRRNLFLCIKEALNNIVKHSKAGKATLTLQIINNSLAIDIYDDGVGIDSNKLNKFGNGLTTMKKRLEKYGGSMGISVNNGTKLSFKVLLDCTVETK